MPYCIKLEKLVLLLTLSSCSLERLSGGCFTGPALKYTGLFKTILCHKCLNIHLVCAALLIPVSVASLPAKQAAADVKAAVGASQHVLQIKIIQSFPNS